MPSISQLSDITIPLVNEPAYSPRKLRVITVGAGFSGLLWAYKYQHEHKDLQKFVDLSIYEAGPGVGGTWRVNTYPGVQCDVPAHIYAFPFDPNPNWKKFYADGDEILEYIEKMADKWDLKKHIEFNTAVVGAEWQEEDGKWKVTVERGGKQRDEICDIFVMAGGFLSRWRWPKIDGINDFKGHKVHSAEWDHGFDYTNKKIALIGNGSSGIQILPKLAQMEGTQIISFQRGPTWITPSLGATMGGQGQEKADPPPAEPVAEEKEPKDMGKAKEEKGSVGSNYNPRYSEEDIKKFHDPEEHKAYRKMLQAGMNKGFRLFTKGSEPNAKNTAIAEAMMREKLGNDPVLCEKLIPKWVLGCRRLTPGEGYLESFLLPNVSLTNSPITKITESGMITDDGTTYDVDVVVCATGFDASNIPHFPVTGQAGMTLKEKWKDEPESYLSLACPQFPNYFIFTGPNATVGHGTLLTSINWSADWMVKWIRKIAREHIKYVVPKQSAADEFVRYGDKIQETLTWTGGCSSWYKNHRVDGRVTATWPGSALLYYQMIEELRPEDFEIRYESPNRFRFMGNGFTMLELDDGNDLAFYVKK